MPRDGTLANDVRKRKGPRSRRGIRIWKMAKDGCELYRQIGTGNGPRRVSLAGLGWAGVSSSGGQAHVPGESLRQTTLPKV